MWHTYNWLAAELIACFLFSIFSCPLVAQEHNAGKLNGRAELAVAAEGYMNNRESFGFFSCRFTVTTGKAQNIQEALNGNLTDPVVSEAYWIVDKKYVKYEVTGDEALLTKARAKPRVGNTVALPFCPEGFLTDGIIQMRHSPPIKGANIWPPGVAGSGMGMTPFGIGIMASNDVMNPGKVLRACADGKVFGRYDGSKQIDGVELLMFFRGDGEDYRLKYWIDPMQGFNPIQITGQSSQTKSLEYRAFFTYRQCEGQRWFPVRGLVVWYPERSDPPFNVREIKVTELNTATPPALSDFYLDLPEKTQVSDPKNPAGYFYVKGQERVKLTDLQGVFDRCKPPPIFGAEGPPASRKIGWTYYLLAAIGVPVFVAGCAWLYFRKRKSGAG
jgi:hypothetical protein